MNNLEPTSPLLKHERNFPLKYEFLDTTFIIAHYYFHYLHLNQNVIPYSTCMFMIVHGDYYLKSLLVFILLHILLGYELVVVDTDLYESQTHRDGLLEYQWFV